MAKRKKSREGEAFVLRDGQRVETRSQLAKAIASMSEDDFRFFCNEAKNDFHTWLRDCLDDELAERIRTVGDRAEVLRILKAK